MDGIQVLAAPSMNLNPGWSFTAQNIGISGMDTASPASAKIFATQRIAFLFSLGMNRRMKAPTMGVNRMMERMCSLNISF